ncbi:MAG TPA: carboxypeptidase regulatory-like domain-containing protein [Pyrinomonadaceae bacterium]|nr:carboxypeptidase regulatory-like domain-containing protein [Pyrinomonadaceae bacterium]
MKKQLAPIHWLSSIVLFLFICLTPIGSLHAQDYVTGSFEGEVKDSATGAPLVGATVRITNQETGVPLAKQTDSSGRFRQGLLPPGDYTITISKQGYVAQSLQRSLPALRPTVVLPPIPLVLESVAAVPSPTPDVAAATPSPGPTPAPTAGPTSTQPTQIPAAGEQAGIREEISTNDARRGGTYPEKEVSTLPLGATTLTRTFDELGLLLPGVAPPPETLGSVAGPGVGAGVGSAGQFSVNGLRSRANNFTVDGSDNNDEDIGVRRQGFLALVPQPIESIREFQMITLLAPAQFGRNFGAQVNAISKSGGNDTHGTIYGFINSSQLNARNFFDTTSGNSDSALVSGGQAVLRCTNVVTNLVTARQTCINPSPITVRNQSGGEDSFTLGQAGFVLGGPLVPETSARPGRSLFYFISMEGHALNASKEVSFAVPTVAQRGLFGSGASGVTFTPFTDINAVFPVGSPNFFFPTTSTGDQLFSFFPFPNNPSGVYGPNTLTQTLPASGQSKILSGKVDGNFRIGERQQFFTARYNFTQDWREIPATGGAIFSTLRPRVRTQNFSTFLNSELSGTAFNQLRLSYGRTRLNFEDVPDRTGFLLPSSFGNPDAEALSVSQILSQALGTPISIAFTNPNDARFLLRAPVIANFTLPNFINFPTSVTPNTGPVLYVPTGATTENLLSGFGPVGQVIIGGFSPVGVDVFNFPQRRINNTYQLADTVTLQKGDHSFAFGADIRRTELNSELPRNARPLISVYGAPRLTGTPVVQRDPETGDVIAVTGFTNLRLGNSFISAVDLAAAGVTSGFFQTLSSKGSSHINLRYYQLDFFGQDEWRLRPNFSLSYGLRYEYNTPARELNRKIESTFNDPLLDLVPGLRRFVDGRTRIFEPDRNNFAPRVGFAYSPSLFENRSTVVRAGYGLFYDQILGAVVSQSRNVFPNFLTANFAGGGFGNTFGVLSNPFCPCIFRNLTELGAIGFFAGTTPQSAVLAIGTATGRGAGTFGATLPARELQMPMAHQYSVTFEQELTQDMVLSAAYVGTQGRNLLRFTTPNLGPNELILPLAIDALGFQPTIYGFALPPGIQRGAGGTITSGRPFPNAGVVNVFETTATSRYDALQLHLRGRYKLLGSTRFQVNYTYGKATDDVSDVFDLAGASALPQNSLTFAGEDGPANFDVRHRVAYNYITDLSSWGKGNAFLRFLFDRTEIAGNGVFQTAQPFTVNSINDVNLDGNLTDRLNSTTGIVLTGDRSRPLRLTVDPATLVAPVGQDGAIQRNSFRASNLWLTNAAVVKTIPFSEHTKLIFRAEAFNLFNRENFGIPVRFLESPGFGAATDTVTPARRIQFGLKLAF